MPDQNESVVREAYAAINRGDLDALAELLSDDVVEHEPFPGLEPDKDGVLEFFRTMRAAFPDLEMSTRQTLSRGDRVAVLGTMKGTHQGGFLGVPPSGERLEVPFADFFRLENGRIAEHWGVTDTGSMMSQMGAGPG